MGREAQCICRIGAQVANVSVHLEAARLTLRGELSRNYELALLRDVQACEGQLRFSAGDEAVALDLGDYDAPRWAKKILAPAPTLAAKFGLSPQHKAFVVGTLDDPVLAEALKDVQTLTSRSAYLLIAIVTSEAELMGAIGIHRALPCRAVWVVHPKGPAASLGETAVRHLMRENGYVDNKSSAVSEALTATRYAASAVPEPAPVSRRSPRNAR